MRIEKYFDKLINPRPRVYVAGKMSSVDSLKFLENLATGIRASQELIRAGYAVFSPFIDFQLFLNLRTGEEISLEDIQDQSLAWLIVSDCLYVLPNYEESKGTLKEIEVAKSYGIPIFYSFDRLVEGL